ncbi:DUF6928 family protein [Streptomyces sp. NPDC020983]|uniref:DUF6928 family protein n=1 Tax=Streptomyces sp. NPDC020983 TaxID=3365106 RepID=UPI00378D062B
MGAKTGLLGYAEGPVPDALRRVAGEPDAERTCAVMRRLYPGWEVTPAADGTLDDTYPANGAAFAGSWPGLDLVCDKGVMVDYPSQLPARLVEASRGRRLVLHAMHSAVDWLAFAVWEDGRLVRSLSISPEDGITEDIGEPLPFERPYWAGERPAEIEPWPGEEDEAYPLPFHPLEFGEDALRVLFGFALEGLPRPADVDRRAVPLRGFTLRDPAGPTPQERAAEIRRLVESMPPPRFYGLQPDGTLAEVAPPFPGGR